MRKQLLPLDFEYFCTRSCFFRELINASSFIKFAVPILALIATYSIPKYMRAMIVNKVERMIDFIVYAVFSVRFCTKREFVPCSGAYSSGYCAMLPFGLNFLVKKEQMLQVTEIFHSLLITFAVYASLLPLLKFLTAPLALR